MQFGIKHNYRIPKSVIDKTIDNINSKMITFGVHAEDDDKHSNRNKVQNGLRHRLLYNNGNPIDPKGNAELLRLNETERETTWYIGGEVATTTIPARPVLLPILQMTQTFNGNIIRNGIKQAFKFRNPQVFDTYLNRFKNKLGRRAVYDFVKGRGMGYWEDGEHNSPYVQAVKFFDKIGDVAYNDIVSDDGKFIKFITDWDVNNSYYMGDTPLMDSLDLLNSIKAKVGKQ